VTSATDGDYSCLADWGDADTITTADAAISVTADCVTGEYLDITDLTSLACTTCAAGTYSETA